MLFFFLSFKVTYSQTDCLSGESSESFSSFLTGDCENTINYAGTEENPEHIPILYINVNIHYMLQEGSDPGNFKETTTAVTDIKGYDYASQVIDEANDKLSEIHLNAINLPIGNSLPNLEARYRYILTGVYFHRDDDFYYFD